jgi:hypothetical protein
MKHNLKRQTYFLILGFGLVQLGMCVYYGLSHRWALLIPWTLSFVFYILWRIKARQEPQPKRKKARY